MAELPTTLEGQLVHITYYNRANHYLIARFKEKDSNSQISILGYFPDPNMGENLRITGGWQNHTKYGPQFRVVHYETMLPETPDSIREYLLSAKIKGLGPKTASRVIRHFGVRTLEVIEKNPQQLADIRGIGRQRVQQIADSWKEHHTLRNLLSFLRDNGVDLSFGARIFREYGAEAIEVLQNTPFKIINDIPRIGFYVADQIVKNSGEPIDELERAKACARYTLKQAGDEGHVFLTMRDLQHRCTKRFDIDAALLSEALDRLACEGDINMRTQDVDHRSDDDRDNGGTAVYLMDLFLAEHGCAEKLAVMLSVSDNVPRLEPVKIKRETVNFSIYSDMSI